MSDQALTRDLGRWLRDNPADPDPHEHASNIVRRIAEWLCDHERVLTPAGVQRLDAPAAEA